MCNHESSPGDVSKKVIMELNKKSLTHEFQIKELNENLCWIYSSQGNGRKKEEERDQGGS